MVFHPLTPPLAAPFPSLPSLPRSPRSPNSPSLQCQLIMDSHGEIMVNILVRRLDSQTFCCGTSNAERSAWGVRVAGWGARYNATQRWQRLIVANCVW
jgi:hypothetical protein